MNAARIALATTLAVATACSPGLQRVRGDVLAYATDKSVVVVAADGTTSTAPANDVPALVFSGDGRYLAYLAGTAPLRLRVRDLATAKERDWLGDDYAARGLGWTSDGFVVVDETNGERLLWFDPAEVLAGNGPHIVPFRGPLPDATVLASRADRLLVGTGALTDRVTTVHDVAADGTATRLFASGEDEPEGVVTNVAIGYAALSADGRRLVYTTGTHVSICDFSVDVAVRDLATDREVAIRPPSLGSGVLTVVRSLTTGADGRTVAGLAAYTDPCGEQPAAGTYVLDGDRWQPLAKGAVWAAASRSGRLATLGLDGRLAVEGKPVAEGVRVAAWSPV